MNIMENHGTWWEDHVKICGKIIESRGKFMGTSDERQMNEHHGKSWHMVGRSCENSWEDHRKSW